MRKWLVTSYPWIGHRINRFFRFSALPFAQRVSFALMSINRAVTHGNNTILAWEFEPYTKYDIGSSKHRISTGKDTLHSLTFDPRPYSQKRLSCYHESGQCLGHDVMMCFSTAAAAMCLFIEQVTRIHWRRLKAQTFECGVVSLPSVGS